MGRTASWLAGLLAVLCASAVPAAMRGTPAAPYIALPSDVAHSAGRVVSGPTAWVQSVGGTVDGAICADPMNSTGQTRSWQSNDSVSLTNVGQTVVRSPRLVVNGRRDWRSVAAVLAEATAGCTTDAERARAVYEFHNARTYHRVDIEAEAHSVLYNLNSYGYGQCDCSARDLQRLYQALGLPVRNGQICNHTVVEVYFDGGWHLFDADLDAIMLARDGVTVAGCDDAYNDHDLIRRTRHHNLRDPNGWEAHQFWHIDQWAASFFCWPVTPNTGFPVVPDGLVDWELLPGATIDFRWGNLGKFYGEDPANDTPQIANGQLVHTPDLGTAAGRLGLVDQTNLAAADGHGLTPALAGSPASAVFATTLPWVEVGAAVAASATLTLAGDAVSLEASTDGVHFTELAAAAGEDDPEPEQALAGTLDALLSPSGRPDHTWWLRVNLTSAAPGSCHLDSLSLTTDFQQSLPSLPELELGDNQVEYRDESSGPRSVQVTQRWVERTGWQRPAAPGLRAPAADATVDGTQVRFSWDAPASEDGVSWYHFLLSDRPELRWSLSTNHEAVTSDTSWALSSVGLLNPGTRYYWHVRARSGNGAWGPWSAARSFVCRAPAVPTGVSLAAAADGVHLTLAWQPGAGGSQPVRYRVYGSNERSFAASDTDYLEEAGAGYQTDPSTHAGRNVDTDHDWTRPANFLAETTDTSLVVVGPEVVRGNVAFYRVVAVDAEGLRSGPSSQAEVSARPWFTTLPPASVRGDERFDYTPQVILSDGHYSSPQIEAAYWERETASFALLAGPAGLSVDPVTGRLSGPVRPGRWPVTLQATASSNVADFNHAPYFTSTTSRRHTQSFTLEVSGPDLGPSLQLPPAQNVPVGASLTLSSANGNALAVVEPVGEVPVRLTLFADSGRLKFPRTDGLSFADGHANGGPNPLVTGTPSALNAALEGLVFTPRAGFGGQALLQAYVDDLGATGPGGSLTALGTVRVWVDSRGGRPVAWGANTRGQSTPPAGVYDAIALASSRDTTLALRRDRTVVAWGNNGNGQGNVPTALRTATSAGVVAVAAGGYHSLALLGDGTVVAWGDNSYGQSSVPAGLGDVVAIAAGQTHSLALRADGTVVGWGNSAWGQATVPLLLDRVVGLAAGANHSVALRNDGTLVAWGSDDAGQTSSSAQRLAPAPACALSAGLQHTAALLSDGSVATWGDLASQTGPFVAFDTHGTHGLGLSEAGQLTCWGTNDAGESTPPASLANVLDVAAGNTHSVALVATWPTALTLSNATLDELAPSGTTIGTLAAMSANTTTTFAYTLVPGQGDSDNALFAVSGNLLRNAAVLLPLGRRSFSVRARATDAQGYWCEQAFTIALTHTNLAPVLTLPGNQTTPANVALVFAPAHGNALTVADPDAGDLPLALTLASTNGSLTLGTRTGVTVADGADGSPRIVLRGSQSALTAALAGLAFTPRPRFGGLALVQATLEDLGQSGTGGSLRVTGTVRVWVASPGWGVAAWGHSALGQCAVPAGLTDAVEVAGGGYWSVALRSGGTLAAWGRDNAGQVTGALAQSGAVAVAAGYQHGLVLHADGSVAAWGDASTGATVVPAALADSVDISAGGYHSLALRADGTVSAWGEQTFGQCTVPTGLTSVLAVQAGWRHSLALKTDGTVAAWGSNTYGESTPPAGLRDVVALAAGQNYSLALRVDGSVVGWGDTRYGATNPAAAGCATISGGWQFALGAAADPLVRAWGDNTYGQTSLPANVLALARGVAAGGVHALALTALPPTDVTLTPGGVSPGQPAGTSAGRLATVSNDSSLTFTYSLVPGTGDTDNARFAIAGDQLVTAAVLPASGPPTYSVRVRSTDSLGLSVERALTVSLWGPLLWLATDLTTPADTPVALGARLSDADASGTVTLALAALHGTLSLNGQPYATLSGTPSALQASLSGLGFVPEPGYRGLALLQASLRDDGGAGRGALRTTATTRLWVSGSGVGVVGWGYNGFGQCVTPAGLTDALGVAAGGYWSLALRADRSLVAWGRNNAGQTSPGVAQALALSAGWQHGLALRPDGTVAAWGDNAAGQASVPAGLGQVVGVSAGGYHSLAVRADGTVAAWGENLFHQCDVPAGLDGVLAVYAGWRHSLALRADGTVVAWGSNSFGERLVPAGLTGVVALSAGQNASLAVRIDGSVVAWGDNRQGETSPVPASLGSAALGFHFGCGLRPDHSIATWGTASFGETTPPAVLGTLTRAVAAGVQHALALVPPPPTAVTLTPTTLADGQAAGTVVGVLATVDPKGGSSFTYTLAAGSGSTDNAAFAVVGTRLVTARVLNGLSQPTYAVRVRSTDALGLWYEQPFTISATHANQPPVVTLPTDATTPAGTRLALPGAAVADPDAGDYPLVLTLAAANGRVSLASTAGLTVTSGANNSARLTVTASQTRLNAALSGLGLTPNAGFGGLATLQLSVSDQGRSGTGGVLSATRTVRVWVASDGLAVCGWGYNAFGQCQAPTGLLNAVSLSAGGYWSLALRADQTLAAWGRNNAGQTTPTAARALAISAGYQHGLALAPDGTVSAWGDGGAGQTTVPAGLANVVGVSAGGYHSLALRADGTVVAWGENVFHQCDVPAGLTGVLAVQAGWRHSLALRNNGTVVAWGSNAYGERVVPASLSNVVALAAGQNTSFALLADGSVTAWGDSRYGATSPTGSGLQTLAAGWQFALGQRGDGTLPGWGSNSFGQLKPPAGLGLPAAGVAAGGQHALALAPTAPLDVNLAPAGLLPGQPSGTAVGTLTAVSGSPCTFALAAGVGADDNARFTVDADRLRTAAVLDWPGQAVFHVRLRATDALGRFAERATTVSLWGPLVSLPSDLTTPQDTPLALTGAAAPVLYDADAVGPLTARLAAINGTLSLTGTPLATLTGSLDQVTAALAQLTFVPQRGCAGPAWLQLQLSDAGGGARGALSRTSTTRIWVAGAGLGAVGWGHNTFGQSSVPSTLTDAVGLSAGGYWSLALRSGRTLVAWGRNDAGQTSVPALGSVLQASAGYLHGLAVTADGRVTAWGGNSDGQTSVPTGLGDVVAVSAGGFHSAALTRAGTVVSWGQNLFHQLDAPADLGSVAAIAAGWRHTLALRTDGTVAAWGSNSYGERLVPAGLTNVVAVAAGQSTSFALRADGTLVVWGDTRTGVTSPPSASCAAVASGAQFGLGLTRDRQVVAWGANASGQTNVPAGLAGLARGVAAGFVHGLALAPALTASLTASPLSPQPALTALTLTAGVGGNAAAAGAQYQFLVSADGGATTTLLRDWGSGNTCPWLPGAAGTYTLLVNVRAGSATAVATATFVVGAS